jgi:hypothetical protein
MVGFLGEPGQQGREPRDLLVGGLRFRGELPLAGLQSDQQRAEGLLRVAAHTPRQGDPEVPVSRRVITSLMAQ